MSAWVDPSSAVDGERQADFLEELVVGDGAGVLAQQPFHDGGLAGRVVAGESGAQRLNIHQSSV